MQNSSGRSSSTIDIQATEPHNIREPANTNHSSCNARILYESHKQQWKKWQTLWSRRSSPEIYSLSSTTIVVQPEDHYHANRNSNDEENTLSGSSTAVNDDNNEEIKKQALISLCKALMLYGAPCHRIEQALEHTAQSLSINATFIFIPGIMMMTFSNTPIIIDEEKKQEQQQQQNDCYGHSQTILIRCPQGLDMGKLTQVNAIIQRMCVSPVATPETKISVHKSIELLDELFSSKPTWNCWVTLISHMMCSLLTAPVMFNGSLLDTALSGALGILIGLLILLSERYTAYCNIFEISTTILVSFITKALNQWVCFTGVVLSATSVLIPGYTLTMSIMELSARHVITGTIRFVYSMIYALFIGYGLEIGTSLYDVFGSSSTTTSSAGFDVCSGSTPPWLYAALFPFMAISMSINLGATMRQWPSMVCCSAIGFGVSVVASKVISNFQIVGTLSAFAVGIFGNLYFKITGDLALVPLSCGIVSLVPGSVGIQGAYFLIRQDDQGMSFATQMVVASLGISVGLFAATLAVSPNERKKSAYLSY